jgi:hypothetical protein
MGDNLRATIEKIRDLPYLPPLTDNDPCGLGKHADTLIKDVPISYFEWMVQQEIDKPLTLHRSRQWQRVMAYIRTHS